MKFAQALVIPASFATLAAAHIAPRQASSATSTRAATSAAAATSAPPASTVVASQVSVSLASTNPSAVPLTAIVSGAAVQPTNALKPNLVPTPGATPPVAGAPVLPSWSYTPGSFPALDLVPPINSSQVQQWIAEVQSSGVTIPGFAPTTNNAACASNPQAAADTSRCWWTCGGCTRDTDITDCPDKLTWGLSYDDGPSDYTSDLLNYLDDQKVKSTFFVVGSRAISRPQILQAEYMAGHQLSVHTWSHPSLTTLTNEQIIAELGWTREAIRQITGVSPNTMRPPYGDIDDRVRAISLAMGMTPIIWSKDATGNFDTEDWHIPSGFSASAVLQKFDSILNSATTLNTGFIVLAHDLYQQTVELAVGYVLPDALARGFTLEPIITCLKKPLSDAYTETNNNSTNPVSSAAAPGTETAVAAGTASKSGSSSSSTGSSKSGNGAVALSGPSGQLVLLGTVALGAIFAGVGMTI